MTKFLDRLSDSYYKGEPLVSNELFDQLAKNYHKVGTSSETEITHEHRMLSLQKVYPGETVPFEGGILTPKLDGAAVEATYKDGRLVWAATRGDGIRGQDVTDKLATILPTDIPQARGKDFQVTGEVVAKLGVDNIRNYASGALNLKSVEEFASRDLSFFAYDLLPHTSESYEGTMQVLREMGFSVVIDASYEEWPTDGKVMRMNSNHAYREAGFTSKHPRGAYALKENKVGVVSTLRDIIWQIGRSGVVSPVAIIDEVDVDGAKVSRATLHNWKYITELNLEPDCKVEVIRAGDIIPRIVRRYD